MIRHSHSRLSNGDTYCGKVNRPIPIHGRFCSICGPINLGFHVDIGSLIGDHQKVK